MIIKNKKAEDNLLIEQIIFWVLNLIFFTALLVFVFNAGSGTAIIEENSAKKIGLVIDNLKLGTKVTLDMPKLFDKAEKNFYTGPIVEQKEDRIIVRAAEGEGHTFYYFPKLPLYSITENPSAKTITISMGAVP